MTVLITVLLVALIGLAGLTMDAGRLLLTYRTLQATADDAALAGAITLPANNATTVATQYSALTGDANARPLLHGTTMVSGYPMAKCLSSLQSQGYVCNSPANGNAVQVKQQITVPVLFMRVLGFQQMTLTAVSTARTGLMDLGSGSYTYNVYVSSGSPYNGTAVDTNNAGLPGGWVTPSANGYTNPDVAWIIPPGGNGSANYSYPSGNYYYYTNAITGITAITQGMVNADDTVSVTLYDYTTSAQVGSTFTTTGNCANGTGGAGGYCNAALAFNFSGLSATHSYYLIANVDNSGGGPTGLLLQAKGYSPAALYRDQ